MSVLIWLVPWVIVVSALTVGVLVLFTWATARKVDGLLPPKGRFVEIDGARVHYIDEGEGPPIVMIHGLAGQGGNFTYSLMERLTPTHRVIVVDRPGSGHSLRPRGASAALRAQAKGMDGFIRALGLERPLVVGHSLGGALALALALDHPQSVGALALISPLTHPQEEVPASFKGMAIASPWLVTAVAWTLALPGSILGRKVITETVFGPEAAPADFGIRGGGLLNARPASFIGAAQDLRAVNDDLPGLVERYGELTVPVGILFGKGDRVLDYRANGEAAAGKIAGLDLELVEDRGHMILMTAPDDTAAFILRMARRIWGL